MSPSECFSSMNKTQSCLLSIGRRGFRCLQIRVTSVSGNSAATATVPPWCHRDPGTGMYDRNFNLCAVYLVLSVTYEVDIR